MRHVQLEHVDAELAGPSRRRDEPLADRRFVRLARDRAERAKGLACGSDDRPALGQRQVDPDRARLRRAAPAGMAELEEHLARRRDPLVDRGRLRRDSPLGGDGHEPARHEPEPVLEPDPRSSRAENAGGGETGEPPNQASSARVNRGSRIPRLAWVIRPLRVSRLNANWIGSRCV